MQADPAKETIDYCPQPGRKPAGSPSGSRRSRARTGQFLLRAADSSLIACARFAPTRWAAAWPTCRSTTSACAGGQTQRWKWQAIPVRPDMLPGWSNRASASGAISASQCPFGHSRKPAADRRCLGQGLRGDRRPAAWSRACLIHHGDHQHHAGPSAWRPIPLIPPYPAEGFPTTTTPRS